MHRLRALSLVASAMNITRQNDCITHLERLLGLFQPRMQNGLECYHVVVGQCQRLETTNRRLRQTANTGHSEMRERFAHIRLQFGALYPSHNRCDTDLSNTQLDTTLFEMLGEAL